MLVLPAVGTPYVIDDVINARLPLDLSLGHMTRLHYVAMMNDSWMYHYGRFFPAAITYAAAVFTTFPTRVAYKWWLVVVMMLLVLAFGRWAYRLLGDKFAAVIAMSSLIACWQFRYAVGYDGLTSFVGIVPWTMLLMTATALLLARRPRRWPWLAIGAATVVWSVTVMTYEYSIILAPAIIASLWLVESTRTWRRRAIAALVGPILLEGGITLWLMVHKDGPTNTEYVLSFKFIPLIEATAKELVATLPLSEYWIPGPSQPPLRFGLMAITTTAVIAVVVIAILCSQWRFARDLPVRTLWLTAAIGAWIWLAPAVLIGATSRWQTQIAWGQSYIPSLFESLGFALIVASGLFGLRRASHGPHNVRLATVSAYGVVVVIGLAVAVTAAANWQMVWG